MKKQLIGTGQKVQKNKYFFGSILYFCPDISMSGFYLITLKLFTMKDIMCDYDGL